MTGPSGPPPNWRVGRQRHLVTALKGVMVLVLVCAVGALVLPDDLAAGSGWVMVASLVAAPLVRVAWLMVRWARIGDHRYALACAALLSVIATGVAITH